MTFVPSEIRFEKYFQDQLTDKDDDGLKYKARIHKKNDNWYDKNKSLIIQEFISFLKESQSEIYEKLKKNYGENTDEKVSSRLNNEINQKGLIHILRKGFNDVSCGNIKTIYFQPNSSLNQKYREEKFNKNRFLFVRQLHYSPSSNKSIDICIFINGIPILTIELKNQLTGQNINNANKQYKFDRDPKGEPLLKFQRCICHFSVDNDEINMTTKLDGKNTVFLPYNKTLKNIETVSDGYKVSYLWDEILTPTSLLDIIENFVLFTHEEEAIWNEKKQKIIKEQIPLLIFPRYHQLEVIRKLKSKLLSSENFENYLIQHTTGSGKSFEIGWLSFMLISLFKNNSKDRIFDSVIIISDRKVLDQQLQKTVKSLEKVRGVVESIEKNSEQLKTALTRGKNIIITTVQKFKYVVNKISELEGQKFAVIIDEVHSSQGGKSTRNLKKTLSINTNNSNEDDLDINEEILAIKNEQKQYQKSSNIAFFGFTGTPKPETLEVFGTLQKDRSKKPFHSYTMRQSIGEGFTLDVLKSFTSIKRYFKLVSKNDSAKLPEKRGKKEIIKWVDSNPKTISAKVEIILDNLLTTTISSIEGQGKGMLVARNIPDTIKFFFEINKQLKERGLSNKVKALISFSEKAQFNGDIVSEGSLNKENGSFGIDITEEFKNPLYRLLIVCDKYQTGFNEPLLQSMFIDKPLKGIQCVQTLSRLNRKKRGKTNTLILDFVNKVEDVKEAFQDFYQTTILSEETDPNSLYDLLDKIRYYCIFTNKDLETWCAIFFQKNRNDSQLQVILNKAITNWESIEEEKDKKLSKALIRNYCKLYSFLSMINNFDNLELFRHYVFLEYLKKKFPQDEQEKIDVSDLVDLDSLDLVIKDDIKISLQEEDKFFEGSSKVSVNIKEDEKLELLSELINEINAFYGQVPEGTEESSKKLIKEIVGDDQFKLVLFSDNTESNKRDKLKKIYKEKNIKTLDVSTKLFEFFNKKETIEKIVDNLISKPELMSNL